MVVSAQRSHASYSNALVQNNGLVLTAVKRLIRAYQILAETVDLATKLAIISTRVLVMLDGLATTAHKRMILVRMNHARIVEFARK